MAALVGVILATVASTTWCMSPYDATLYEDALFQDLYKRLSQIEDTYYPAGDDGYGGPAGLWDDDGISLDARDSGQTDIRDPEYLSQSTINAGFQHISGGAGEGKQHLTPDGTQENTQEVKSDDVLPFYCHPPNPCPKGFTADDGCQPDITDSAETQKNWISSMQRKGMCSCDTEHMFDCPKGPGGLGDEGMGSMTDNDALLDNVITSLLGDKSENPFTKGNKRGTLVSKKSPRIKRSVDALDDESNLDKIARQQLNRNPYLTGPKLRTAAKKGTQWHPQM